MSAGSDASRKPRRTASINPTLPQGRLDLFSLRSQGWSAFELLDFAAKLGVESRISPSRAFLAVSTSRICAK